MKNIKAVSQDEVMDYWRSLEKCPKPERLRSDILNDTFPAAVVWESGEIEDADLPRLYLLHTSDFRVLSKDTWRILPAAEYFEETFSDGQYDPEHSYHAERIRKLLAIQSGFDRRLITVAESENGPLMMLDGNHRAILMQADRTLVGSRAYCAINPAMASYSWMRWPLQDWRQRNPA